MTEAFYDSVRAGVVMRLTAVGVGNHHGSTETRR
jgi:hypothetical protein